MGAPLDVGSNVNQKSFEYTSTRSIFTLDVADKVEMKVTFLSPVVPDDLMKASLPQSYINVDVYSTDGNQHDVQLYTDISAGESAYTSTLGISLTNGPEWVSGDRDAIAQWSYDISPDDSYVAYHKLYRQEQLPFAEINQQTEYGYWYYSTLSTTSLTHRTGGTDVATRQQFATNGSLDNSADTNYRPIRDSYPVFAFAQDLGSVGSTPVATTFQLSLHQNDAVQFLGEGQDVQVVPSLWTSYFSDDVSAVSDYYNISLLNHD
jgi:hypothetical protein